MSLQNTSVLEQEKDVRQRARALRSHRVWILTETSENSVSILPEDEAHVLFHCLASVQMRQKYGPTELINQPDWSHVQNIQACEGEPQTINLSKFLTLPLDIWKKENRASSAKSVGTVLFFSFLFFFFFFS